MVRSACTTVQAGQTLPFLATSKLFWFSTKHMVKKLSYKLSECEHAELGASLIEDGTIKIHHMMIIQESYKNKQRFHKTKSYSRPKLEINICPFAKTQAAMPALGQICRYVKWYENTHILLASFNIHKCQLHIIKTALLKDNTYTVASGRII